MINIKNVSLIAHSFCNKLHINFYTCVCGKVYKLGTEAFNTAKLETPFHLRNKLIFSNALLTRRGFHTNQILFKAKNYYEILNISRNASQKDIKKAYYQLAKKYHPDTNKNDPNTQRKFQEVSEAYEVLSDENKRKQYDAWGTTSEQMGAGGGPGPSGGGPGMGPESFGGNWNFHSEIDPEEFFRKIFGSGARFSEEDMDEHGDSGFGYGSAKEIVMSLTFEQAARGCNKDVSMNVVDTCKRCRGTRCEPGTSAHKCSYCDGTGMETISTGPFVMRTTCRNCHGARVIIKSPCVECQGKGSVVQRRKVTVPVPAGVEDGQTVRMTVGRKEVFITFKVTKSDYFRRDGPDVHTDAQISLSQALLGGTIRVTGLYEDQTVMVEPGTSSHTVIRLNGQGVKKVNSLGHGDHYVHLKIVVPKNMNKKQKSLVLAYAELETDTPGVICGISSNKDGTKRCRLEPQDLLQSIREALDEGSVKTDDIERTPSSRKGKAQ